MMLEYVTKTMDNKIVVLKDQVKETLDMPLTAYLSHLAIAGMSTLKGRINAIRRLFNFKSKVPLYLDWETLLIPLTSIRSDNSVLVNYHAILSFRKDGKRAVIVLSGAHEMLFPSYKVFLSQYKKAKEIILYREIRGKN